MFLMMYVIDSQQCLRRIATLVYESQDEIMVFWGNYISQGDSLIMYIGHMGYKNVAQPV